MRSCYYFFIFRIRKEEINPNKSGFFTIIYEDRPIYIFSFFNPPFLFLICILQGVISLIVMVITFFLLIFEKVKNGKQGESI